MCGKTLDAVVLKGSHMRIAFDHCGHDHRTGGALIEAFQAGRRMTLGSEFWSSSIPRSTSRKLALQAMAMDIAERSNH